MFHHPISEENIQEKQNKTEDITSTHKGQRQEKIC